MKTADRAIHSPSFHRMHQKIRRGLVWCRKCATRRHVDPLACVAYGWPVCCDETMTIDSPTERGVA